MPYTVETKQGNLLDEKNATFIVNASNTRLILGSGVSMAFKERCGLVLEYEMQEKLGEIDTLNKGDVVVTSSGEAKHFDYAMHVAVMDYAQGVRGTDKYPTLKEIKTALENIELYLLWFYKRYPDKKLSLTLPLLGCGVGNLQKNDVIHLYKRFFSRKVSLKCSVVIYGYTEEDFALIESIFM